MTIRGAGKNVPNAIGIWRERENAKLITVAGHYHNSIEPRRNEDLAIMRAKISDSVKLAEMIAATMNG